MTVARGVAGHSLTGRLPRRWVSAGLTVGIVIGIVVSTISILPEVRNQWGEDYRFFVGAAAKWQATGSFYLDRQLAGPYEAQSAVDILYPPPALLLFLPFVYLPAFLWWAIPLGIIAMSVAWHRPAWWSWPVLALLAWIPRDQSIVIWGNTTMWIAAFVALALLLAWPAVLVLLKPTFAPLALIGVRHRSWWIAGAAFVMVQLPFLSMWGDWMAAMQNNVGDWPPLWYSLPDFLFVAIPLVVWYAATRNRHASAAGLRP